MEEVYCRIKGFDNYAVSNLGNVINIKKYGKLVKQSNSNGYYKSFLKKDGIRKQYFIHRIVADTFIDKVDGKKLVDHINGDKMDNKISNLRWCNYTENSRNRKISSLNTSSVKGVSYVIKRNKWRAQIRINIKLKHIGDYNTLEEATIARQNKAMELFGDFLNECEKIK